MKWWQRIPLIWRQALLLWLGMRLLLWTFGAVIYHSGWFPMESPSSYGIDILSGPLSGALFGVWMRWDGVYYDLLLTEGYRALPQISAFWPFFPLSSLPFYWLGIHSNIALILSANLFFLIAIRIFLEEVQEHVGREKMISAGAVLVSFPGAFFFFTPYPTSLALLFILLTWRFCRKDHLLLASITGLLSGLTHPSVVPIIFLIFLIALKKIKNLNGLLRWIILIIPIMPIAGVAIFLAWRENQGFLPYVQLLTKYWGTQVFDLKIGFTELLDYLFSGNVLVIMKLLILILVIWSIVWMFRNRFFVLGSYQVILLVYSFSITFPGDPLGNIIRYSLMSFPTYIAIGVWILDRPKRFIPSLLGLNAINLFICGFFLNWVYVS